MKKRYIWIICASVLLWNCRKPEEQNPSAAPEGVAVKATRARLADVQKSITAPATLYPREQANISSSTTAPIRALHARKGDAVTKGQILAQLEDRDLVAQKGEALAAVNQASVLRERRSQLFAQGAIPQRDLLATQTDFAQSQARLQRIEALSRFTVLRSPFSGTIVEQFLHVGDMVKPDTPVFTVVDLGVAIARAQVPEVDVAMVKRGQQAVFVPQDGSGSFPGKITMINEAVDMARRTVEVWCEIPNNDAHLRSGAFGKLIVTTAKQRQSIVVPRSAVQLLEGGRTGTIVVVDDQNHVHRKSVDTLEQVGDTLPITSGLAQGELVVVEGGYELPDNTLVRVAVAPPVTSKDAAP